MPHIACQPGEQGDRKNATSHRTSWSATATAPAANPSGEDVALECICFSLHVVMFKLTATIPLRAHIPVKCTL
jgi:hypothetical protein